MYRPAWGKFDPDAAAAYHHALACHCMDVAAVFARLIDLPVVRPRLDTAAGRPLTDQDCARLSALTFLHDVGKLHPGFQAKAWPEGLWQGSRHGHVSEGLDFLDLAFREPRHPFHRTMTEIVESWGDGAAILIDAVLAHHGRPAVSRGEAHLRDWPSLPHYDWHAETAALDAALRRWFAPAFERGGPALPESSAFQHQMAGLVALADWIGSDTRFFEFRSAPDAAYDEHAHARAADALATIGLDPAAMADAVGTDFESLTGFAEPRPAQTAVGATDVATRLVTLEAETGSGKTEAALWRFLRLFAAGEVSGLYFAVPTRAAARQLHGRVNDAIRRVFGQSAPEAVLAIPGMLRAGEAEGRKLPHWRVLWEDRNGAEPARWAAEHATRFLAAPVAVGTVDQALLAGLQVKHAHLRGSALSRSLLVVDEVHASDSYMIAVLRQLLAGHLAVGGHAMLMSATLGARARAYVTRQEAPDLATARAAPYPTLWAGDRPVDCGPATTRGTAGDSASKSVELDTRPTMDADAAARDAIAAAAAGARVLVIRNTVTKAVATWRAVQDAGGTPLLMHAAGQPALHHSRFAVEDRALLDRAAETLLSTKPARPPGGAIAIGTQTLEQSLDIDADVLVTDLCPVDVLLQRIGRLHRHRLPRPDGFATPRVRVLLPESGIEPLTQPKRATNGLGYWEENERVAGIYTDVAGLELTRRLIADHPVWRIPEMNRFLVETATHPESVAALLDELGEPWRTYDRKFGGTEAARGLLAENNALDRTQPFIELQFPEGDETIMTRLGEPGAMLSLDPPPQGPFGRTITRIALPAHWSQGICEDDPVTVSLTESGLRLQVSDRTFRYTAAGLEREG